MSKNNPSKRRDEFPLPVARKLAERAGHICANPDCHCLTAGPAERDPELVVKKGRACHICAAAENGPRYDKDQDPKDRMSASNGLWLCANCSDIVDKNNGTDFTVDELKMWKKKHEDMIRSLIRSNASPLALARRNTQEANLAQSLVDFMEGKGAFYIPADFEHHPAVVRSLEEVRKEIGKKLDEIPVGDKLYDSIKVIRNACQEYMNNTSTMNSPMEVHANLAIMRKKIGIVLRSIQEQYGVKIGGQLASILPVFKEY